MCLNKLHIMLMGIVLAMLTACVHIEEHPNTPRDNFEVLWKAMDEHYCFFDYKGVDWDRVYTDYVYRIDSVRTAESLFYLLNDMLREVRDGHVNLVSPFDMGRYWIWEQYPANYSEKLITNYLGTNYRIAGGLHYKILPNGVGYVRYASFSSSIGESGLDYVIDHLSACPGIILDIRNNGGGYLTNSDVLASRFFDEKTLVGYIQHKTGTGHNDFSAPWPLYVEPSSHPHYKEPVVVLTNRKCYSATNDFVNAIRYASNVTTLGDTTGGGSGLPFTYELPCGWTLRLSACPSYDADMQQIEFGIAPDVPVALSEQDELNGFDTLIETACQRILSGAP